MVKKHCFLLKKLQNTLDLTLELGEYVVLPWQSLEKVFIENKSIKILSQRQIFLLILLL